MQYNAMYDVTCDHCGIDYQAQTLRGTYCSSKCRTAACRLRKKTKAKLLQIGIDPTNRILTAKHIKRLDRIRGYSFNAAEKVHELQRCTNSEIAGKAVDALYQLLYDLNIPELKLSNL